LVRHRRGGLIAFAVISILGASGCGEGGGVARGATVTAYVEAPLCAGARSELARESAHADAVRVRAVCLSGARAGTRLDLATVGADARRATEDSTSVAYLEARDPAASRFSRPILESAGIAQLTSSSGEAAMRQVLHAITDANSSSLRDSVFEALNEP
jgi:hypothetical protein